LSFIYYKLLLFKRDLENQKSFNVLPRQVCLYTIENSIHSKYPIHDQDLGKSN